jgi:predicted DCC family thiol-disulfide oxidoreductase YuxK
MSRRGRLTWQGDCGKKCNTETQSRNQDKEAVPSAIAEPARDIGEHFPFYCRMKNECQRRQRTVIYDGHCGFCRQQVERLSRLDITGRLRFVSLHHPGVATEFPDLSHEQMMAEMWVVAPDGSRYGGIRAINQICRALPVLWPLATVLAVPGMINLGSVVYRYVAERRYRLAGSTCSDDGCRPGKYAE